MPIIRGCVVSDLHYLSRRSTFDRFRSQCLATFRTMDVVVLNGDIFDFRWSTHPSLAESVDAALAIVEQWLIAAPQTRFYYVLGNHDSHPAFVQALQNFSATHTALEIVEHELQIGSSLFIHGDVLHAKSIDRLPRYRAQFHDEISWKRLDGVYQLAHHTRLAALYGHIQSAQAQAVALESLIARGEIPTRGCISDIYYGHTHALSTAIQVNSRCYHNTGAMLLGIPWQILTFEETHER